MENLSVTISDACKLVGIGKTRMYELLNSGAIPGKKLGNKTLILKSDLDSFLANLDAYKAETEVQNG